MPFFKKLDFFVLLRSNVSLGKSSGECNIQYTYSMFHLSHFDVSL